MNIDPVTPSEVASLGDDALVALQSRLAAARRVVESASAVVAAEIGHRSRRELGYDGLAQRHGLRTPEALIQQVTGLSGSEARTLVRVGTATVVRDAVDPTPWLAPVSAAVLAGAISVNAADVIRAGLGSPTETVLAGSLAAAAAQLVLACPSLTLEKLAAQARRLRDELDTAGIAEREQERRDRRYLSLTPQPDGMTRITGLLDPESAAVIIGAVDAITAPRRGGPRFIDESSTPSPVDDDERTVPQMMTDALVDLIRIATLADTGTVLGGQRVGVRIHIAETDLRSGTGAGHLEGQSAPISIATVNRHICESGIVPIITNTLGQPLDVGRTQRLFTTRQRIALAARDGGCIHPDCDRPPSWCEAHHITHWEHGGRTDTADGVLLCRFHHLWIHNNSWHITRTDNQYWLNPPPGSERAPIPLHSKNPIHQRILASA